MAEAQVQSGPGRELALGVALGAAGAALALTGQWRLPLLLAGAASLAALCVWTLAGPYRWLALFFGLTLLAPPLPFALGSTGPHLALLAAALGLVGVVMRQPALRLPPSGMGFPLGLYLGVLALSAAPALWISGAGEAAASLIRTALLGITLLVYLAVRHGAAEIDAAHWARNLLLLGGLTAVIGCLDFALQLEPPAGYGEQMVWLTGRVVRRAQGVFYDAAQFGNVCAFFLVGTAAAALRGRAARPAALGLAAVALTAALVFSFSRGAMLNAAAGLAVLAVITRRSWMRNARLAAGAAAVAAGSAVIALVAAPEFTSTYAMRFTYTAWRAVSDPAEALGVRLESWSRLLQMLADHPSRLLLGAGYRTLAGGAATGEPLIVDNQWLTTLGETGLLGLAVLAILMAAVLRASWRTARSASANAAFLGTWSLCFWCGQLVQMLFVDLMTYWRVLPVYIAVLALAEREDERRPA